LSTLSQGEPFARSLYPEDQAKYSSKIASTWSPGFRQSRCPRRQRADGSRANGRWQESCPKGVYTSSSAWL